MRFKLHIDFPKEISLIKDIFAEHAFQLFLVGC